MGKQDNQKILLISDYDGTISPLNLKANINAIRKFIDDGNIFAISTARSRSSILKKIKKYDIPVNYITSNNGSEIMNANGEIISVFEMNRGELTFIHNQLLANNPHVTDVTFVNKNGNVFRDGIIPNNAIMIRCTCPLYYDLRSLIAEIPGYTCYRFGATFEIKPSYIDKSFAANELISYLKNKDIIKEITEYSIGNTMNDYELLKNHNGYVVSYGSPFLKRKIKTRTSSVSSLIATLK